MSTIRVHAGDLQKGDWQFIGLFGASTMMRKGEKYDFSSDVERVDQLDEEKVKKFAGAAAGGLVGAALLGPVGAIGGILLGGNKREVVFSCHLRDGRKFMATTSGKTWKKITAAMFDRS